MSNVSAAIIRLLKPLGRVVNAITCDNGTEFANHQAIGCMSYFAKPYHSWERG
jgi:IS30 family transposase